MTNVRDATDWANKLVQKIYTNPFVLSPFYKPNHEDLRVQAVFDTAQVFMKGAQELRDTVKTLDTMMARPATPQQQQEISASAEHADPREPVERVSPRLAEALKTAGLEGGGEDAGDDCPNGRPYLRGFD